MYSPIRLVKKNPDPFGAPQDSETAVPLYSQTRLGICCQNTDTLRLLRKAALDAAVECDFLSANDALQWLETHPEGLLLVQASVTTAKQIQLDMASHQHELSHQVVFLQASEKSNPPAMLSARSTTRKLPTNAKEAASLIAELFSPPVPPQVVSSTRLIAHAKQTPGSSSSKETLCTDDEAFDLGQQLAAFPVDLLLIGETGSGKDSLAKFIFQHAKTTGNFVAINCAAIPEQLAEAELFGYEAGSFTGATTARPGKFEDADKGVLYLDEVDSCPLWLQAKLLRVLQDKGSERLGSSKFRPSDFRLIASTKADLPTLVAKGLFREDLYFRLNVIEIRLTPLRSRPERLQALFEHFVAEACQRFGLPPKPLDAGTLDWLLQNPWPGNIRELKSAATRFVLPFARESKPPTVTPNPEPTSLREALDTCERNLIMRTLARTQGNVSQAALDLGVPMNTLYYRMKRLQINPKPSA